MILALKNKIRGYAWGSRTAIAELLGEPTPSPNPQAELWIGAHPDASSQVVVDHRPIPLYELIDTDPLLWLGEDTVERFGPRLPFLLKVLAAARPLSLQAHPSLERARQGFASEEAGRVPRDAPDRNYRDDNHKPELLCALSPFDALLGFQAFERIVETLRFVNTVELHALLDTALRAAPQAQLSTLFGALLSQPPEAAKRLSDAAVASAKQALASGNSPIAPGLAAWIPRLAEDYPGDVGVLATLMLNLVHLEPGQALYLPPGSLHSYLSGVSVEVMASSDNVLRGGLTPKHVNISELLAVLEFGSAPPRVFPPAQTADGERIYQVPVPDFELRSLSVSAPHTCRVWGPELLLCTEGSANVTATGGDYFALSKGEAAFVAGTCDSYVLGGRATVYRATVSPR